MFLYCALFLVEGEFRVDGIILDSPMHSPKFAVQKVSLLKCKPKICHIVLVLASSVLPELAGSGSDILSSEKLL